MRLCLHSSWAQAPHKSPPTQSLWLSSHLEFLDITRFSGILCPFTASRAPQYYRLQIKGEQYNLLITLPLIHPHRHCHSQPTWNQGIQAIILRLGSYRGTLPRAQSCWLRHVLLFSRDRRCQSDCNFALSATRFSCHNEQFNIEEITPTQ